MFCTNCGKELPENALFCPSCGKSIFLSPATSPVSSQTTPIADINQQNTMVFTVGTIALRNEFCYSKMPRFTPVSSSNGNYASR